MAQVTYYVALPFVTDDGVATCEPLEAAPKRLLHTQIP